MHRSVGDSEGASVGIPVGSADDPRAITHEVSRETAWLSKHLKPAIQSDLVANEEGGVYGTVTLKIRNPVQQPVEFALTPLSDDLFWSFTPDHWHGVIEAGAETELELQLERQAAGLNANFRFPKIEVAAEYLTATRRLSVPTQAFEIPISLGQWSAPPRPPPPPQDATARWRPPRYH